MEKRFILFLIFLVVVSATFLFWKSKQESVERIPREGISASLENAKEGDPTMAQQEIVPQKDRTEDPEIIFIDQKVPFVVQAPGGSWSDPRRQDGCEEASMLMVMYWVKERNIIDLEKELDEISLSMERQLGTFRDTSIRDTFLFIYETLHLGNVVLRESVGVQDIRNAILSGNIVAVTVNGQKLHNPYFTPPGPEYHMLIVRGYDPATDEFIVNDPGTVHGEGYRYKTYVLFGAMQDYETGYHKGIHPEEKLMLEFSKISDL